MEKGLFRPCCWKELPWKPDWVSVSAWLWMKSHQWAFLWNYLAVASSTLEAGLSHFFCLSWLPCTPCTLDANRHSLPSPAALPWLCLCRRRKGRAEELGGSIQPVAVDGCCSFTREGSQLPAGNTRVSGWREGAGLASALRRLA